MHLNLLPVYSRLADQISIPSELAKAVPAGWELSQHQVETYEALCNHEIDVVINTAMTGDGKSLAGQLPLLVHDQPTLTLYPTNELIRDQYQNIKHNFPDWNCTLPVERLYSAKLDELAAIAESSKRNDQLLALLKNNTLVLSNPDIFHNIMQFGYTRGIAPDWIVGPLNENYRQLVFDEFHIFDITQVAAVITGLLFLLANGGAYRMKTLFLSATPGETLLPLIKHAGLQDRVKQIEGHYTYDDEEGTDTTKWRQILQPVDLTCVAKPEGGIETWMDQEGEAIIRQFFDQHSPAAKGAIIVNSVATAHRLLKQLRDAFPHFDIKPNTGLTDSATKVESRNADLLIGTSTVDIGVDFQINFLIYEASDAGNFVQRLGRIGRHKSFVDRTEQTRTFDTFVAYALLPDFVYRKLFVGSATTSPLWTGDSDRAEREDLNAAARTAFPKPASFDQYLPIWGRFQPAQVLNALSAPTVRDAYKSVVAALEPQYRKVFHTSIRGANHDSRQFKAEGRTALIQEARSFRGGSPFDCGVFMPEQQEPLTYNLFWLLANTQLSLMDKDAFLREVARRGWNPKPFDQGYQIAFFQVYKFLPQRETVVVNLNNAHDVQWDQAGMAQVISGVRVECDGFADLNDLNRILIRRKFAAWLCPGTLPQELRKRAYLPGLFPVQKFVGNNTEGTVAFGRQALILDAIAHRKSSLCTPPLLYAL